MKNIHCLKSDLAFLAEISTGILENKRICKLSESSKLARSTVFADLSELTVSSVKIRKAGTSFDFCLTVYERLDKFKFLRYETS